MKKDTIYELLKIFAMIVILAALIFGIVWLNKSIDESLNEIATVSEEIPDK